MWQKRMHLIVVMLVLALVFAACSKKDGEENGDDKFVLPTEPDPVELTIWMNGASGEEAFMNNFGNSIVAKYPHISFKYLQSGGDAGVSVADAITAGEKIDIVHTTLASVPELVIGHGLHLDHADLIRRHNFDLETLYPQAVAAQRNIGSGTIYGLPSGRSNHKLFYNKDLFDNFGVPYPKDNMTWDELYELARIMTRSDGDQQYYGMFIMIDQLALNNQLTAGFVDPATKRSLFADDKWHRFMNNLYRFTQIPGNEGATVNGFRNQGRVAMMVAGYALNASWQVNWDVAKFPSFPDLPGVANTIQGNFWGVTSVSDHKDDAFLAISHLASKDFQTEQARRAGLKPIVQDIEVQLAYGAEVDWLEGRSINIPALFPDMYAEPYVVTGYDGLAIAALVEQWNLLIRGQVPDVNTALRQAAEATEQAIAQREQ